MTKQKATLNTHKRDCASCKACAADYQADNLKHAIARLNGVSSIKVDGVTGKVVVKFDDAKIDISKITQRMEKLGYHVEVAIAEDAK
jgi:copper chaperone CopZ